MAPTRRGHHGEVFTMRFPDRPELMVIGDSLAQGCRSLSVTAEYCSQSHGARVAGEMQYPYASPDYPQPVIFDLEALIRGLPIAAGPFVVPLLAGAFRRMRENISGWAQRFQVPGASLRNQSPVFSNLGETGAKFSDLLARTARQSQDEIDAILAINGLRALPPLKKIGDLHLAILSRFVLNPANDPTLMDITAMELVERREPVRLVVQIGHNHGLYGCGGSGIPKIVFDDEFWDGVTQLAERLASLSTTTKEIYYFLLPKVSAVANLTPHGAVDADGYAESYEPVFGLSTSTIDRAAMRKIDAEVIKANNRIAAILREKAVHAGTEERLCFIDTYEVFDNFDYKNRRTDHYLIPAGDAMISNMRLLGRWDPKKTRGPRGRPAPGRDYRLFQGGFQSIDGMHPSGAGYALVAAILLERMWRRVDQREFVGRAFKQDTLLTNYPQNLDVVFGLLNAIRDATRGRKSADVKAMLPEIDPEHPDGTITQVIQVATSTAER